MSAMPPANVVDRIKKLMALSDNNSNEHESRAAAAKAQSLLAEYNLELSQLGDTTSTDATREKNDRVAAAAQDWQVTLMQAIAANNFCLHWTTTVRDRNLAGTGKVRARRRHVLVGRTVNVTSIVQMYNYLVQAMERLCPYQDARDRSTRSWYDGCTDRLRSRLETQRYESEAASRAKRAEPNRGTGTDLVLSDVFSSEEDLNTDLWYGYTPGTTAARRAQAEATREQYEAERRVRLEARRAAEAAARAAETPAERAAREAKEAREAEREEARWRRYQDRQEAKIDRNAYHQGSQTGRDIGLDRQVEGGKNLQIG